LRIDISYPSTVIESGEVNNFNNDLKTIQRDKCDKKRKEKLIFRLFALNERIMIEKFKAMISTWASIEDIEMFYVLFGLKSMFSIKSNGS
jgi:hypothetical protein